MILFQLKEAGLDSKKRVRRMWAYIWFNCCIRVVLDNSVAINVTGSLLLVKDGWVAVAVAVATEKQRRRVKNNRDMS